MGVVQRYVFVSRFAQTRGVGSSRGAARAVQRLHLLAAGGGIEYEAVAADAGHLRLTDAQKNGARNGGVHRVSALFQYVDSNLRRERMGRGAHAVRGQNG